VNQNHFQIETPPQDNSSVEKSAHLVDECLAKDEDPFKKRPNKNISAT
jgi:hypothetical protein